MVSKVRLNVCAAGLQVSGFLHAVTAAGRTVVGARRDGAARGRGCICDQYHRFGRSADGVSLITTKNNTALAALAFAVQASQGDGLHLFMCDERGASATVHGKFDVSSTAAAAWSYQVPFILASMAMPPVVTTQGQTSSAAASSASTGFAHMSSFFRSTVYGSADAPGAPREEHRRACQMREIDGERSLSASSDFVRFRFSFITVSVDDVDDDVDGVDGDAEEAEDADEGEEAAAEEEEAGSQELRAGPNRARSEQVGRDVQAVKDRVRPRNTRKAYGKPLLQSIGMGSAPWLPCEVRARRQWSGSSRRSASPSLPSARAPARQPSPTFSSPD